MENFFPLPGIPPWEMLHEEDGMLNWEQESREFLWEMKSEDMSPQENDDSAPQALVPILNWPDLDKRSMGSDNVQQMAFKLWSHYQEFRNLQLESSGRISEIFPFDNLEIPILDKPPGYRSRYVEHLQLEIEHDLKLAMNRAVFIVDYARNGYAQSIARDKGDRVGFAGPASRTMDDTIFKLGEKQVYIARMGADRVPASSSVKPWRFDVVENKDEETAPWFVCVYFPFSKQKRRRRNIQLQLQN